MAPPAKVNAPPQTLPADFFDKQGSPPETLPADFDFGTGQGDTPKPPPTDAPNRFQKAFDAATQTKPIGSEPGISGFLDTTLGNVGGGVLSLAAPLFHPEQTAKTLLNTASGMFSSGPGWGEPVKLFSDAPSMQESLIQGAKSAKKQPSESGKQYAARIGGEALAASPQVAAAIVTPEAVERTATKLADLVPTRAKAGRLLDEVKTAANGKPISFSRTTPALEKAQRLSLWGHGNVTPVDSLYQRMNTVNPIDFEEARGRYTPLTRLTSSDKMRATPQLQAAARQVAHAMREDIGDTARSVGKGDQYEKGMNMYARAARNREMAGKLLKYGARGVLAGAGLGGAYELSSLLKK